MRNNKLAAMIAIITAALLLHTGGSTAGDTSCKTDEYELMSLLIREQYGSEFSPILIGRDTEPWCLSEHLGFLQRMWPRLKGETIDSLIINNSGAPHRLAENFSLPVEYRLMSYDEFMQILSVDEDPSGKGKIAAGADAAATGTQVYTDIRSSAEPNWDNFDRIFPDAQGYLIFSKVGFDSKCTQALVIFSNAYRCSGVRTRPQTREIAFFSRRGGAWELVGTSRRIKAMY